MHDVLRKGIEVYICDEAACYYTRRHTSKARHSLRETLHTVVVLQHNTAGLTTTSGPPRAAARLCRTKSHDARHYPLTLARWILGSLCIYLNRVAPILAAAFSRRHGCSPLFPVQSRAARRALAIKYRRLARILRNLRSHQQALSERIGQRACQVFYSRRAVFRSKNRIDRREHLTLPSAASDSAVPA